MGDGVGVVSKTFGNEHPYCGGGIDNSLHSDFRPICEQPRPMHGCTTLSAMFVTNYISFFSIHKQASKQKLYRCTLTDVHYLRQSSVAYFPVVLVTSRRRLLMMHK